MRLLRSFTNAFQGIKYCLLREKNYRIQFAIAVIIFAAAIFFSITTAELMQILFCFALVLSLEMINTSIEKLSNEVCQSISPVIKQVKDVAAGAVLLASVIGLIIGLFIFLPKIILLFK